MVNFDTEPSTCDMDGHILHKGDSVVCIGFRSNTQPCLSEIIEICEDGKVRVDNGKIVKIVEADSCIFRESKQDSAKI